MYKSVITTLAILLGFSFSSYAEKDISVNVNVGIELEKLDLTVDIVERGAYPQNVYKVAPEEMVLRDLSMGSLETVEGIPNGNLQLSDRFIMSTFDIGDAITEALDESRNKTMGRKIEDLVGAANFIIDTSLGRQSEFFVRVILNRCVDIHNLTLALSGENTAFISTWFANFMTTCFEHAAHFANNNVVVDEYYHQPDHYEDVVEILTKRNAGRGVNASVRVPTKSAFEFGHEMAIMLYGYSASATSELSKIIMLIRTLGYLGYDSAADQRARSERVQKTLVRIHTIQNKSKYRRILGKLKREQAITQGDVSWMRNEVYRLLYEKIPTWSGDEIL